MLYIISTPIGNLDDISIRAIKTIFSVDVLLCEDTRRTGQLIKELRERYASILSLQEKQPQLVSYYDEIEDKKIPEIVELLKSGQHIGLVSDNGTPTINDPGFRLVRACTQRSIPVISVPGPNAAIAALSISGLPTDTFTFLGFLPEKDTARKNKLEILKVKNNEINFTYIAYCSPHKLQQTLETFQEVYGNNFSLVICRELTKVHEEVWRGTIEEAVKTFTDPKGELVLLWRT